MAGLERFHFNIMDEHPATRGAAFGGRRSEAPPDADVDPSFTSDEAAARFHLSRLLAEDRRPAVRGVTAPERAERVPDLRVVDIKDQPGVPTKLVRFEQTQENIPVFGAHAVCELTEERGFVSASGRVGRVEGVSSFPTVSQEEARDSIARFTRVEPDTLRNIAPAKLNFFEDEKSAWHLVWLFEDVPAAEPGFLEGVRGHGMGGSPRTRNPLFDYLVDAHSAKVVFYFSANPLLGPLPVPVYGTGVSEDGQTETLWGRVAGTEFELNDPSRDIRTHDLGGGDVDHAALGDPYRAASSDLGMNCKGIVSAHANSTKVYDFFNSVLLRDGIDDAGMELINVVNCTSPDDETPPAWHNAQWWNDRMWYGQAPDEDGTLVSFARFLDVIAHELTHGVTKFTADLVYRDQSGALNESVSDIFGIIIKNWVANPPDGGNVPGWDWELGSGLGDGGLPLRDMSDPARTNHPAHMDDYDPTSEDEGGVHTNSNIHNKAAYNVLTATDSAGQPVFSPREVALLYYLALTRLGRTDGFDEMLTALLDVASSMYSGEDTVRASKVEAIRTAYRAVGIT
jgi:bacillolysin